MSRYEQYPEFIFNLFVKIFHCKWGRGNKIQIPHTSVNSPRYYQLEVLILTTTSTTIILVVEIVVAIVVEVAGPCRTMNWKSF